MYAGYITVNESSGKNLFYWLVQSQHSPSSDPLILWLQGGPGCSGLLGLMMEHGPVHPTQDGGLQPNPWSWNRFANLLYVESPVGVGFSFSKTPSDYNTDNNQTAADNLAFLHGFLDRFPEYSGNPLWIAGESYGGDYVPQLVSRILADPDPPLRQSLKGFAIGNPVFSCQAWKNTANSIYVDLFYYHGLIPFSQFWMWRQTCGATPPTVPPGYGSCDDFLTSITALIGNFDPDNLYTNFFTGNASLGPGPAAGTPIQNLTNTYLNRADVQAAIHAQPAVWTQCCAEEGQSGGSCLLNYTNTWSDMLPLYQQFFTDAPELQILIYSGDTDIATCPHAYAQLCLSELQRPLAPGGLWRPWVVDQQTAGYVEVHDRYTYATVKGAGHEVPLFQPAAAYQLLTRFMSGQPL